MAKNIIFAHGILGFGNIGWLLPMSYFNGVAKHLRQQGHLVTEPSVAPLGSIQERGTKLAKHIKELDISDKAHIIAHSMGGLDARYALANDHEVAARIATLVTIGTPHRGSPLADAAVNLDNTLLAAAPSWLRNWFIQNKDTAAVYDLTISNASHFDETTPNVAGVRYIEVAGNTSKAGNNLPLSKLAALVGSINQEINDGIVTRSSALHFPPTTRYEHLDDWPVDHAGEIGWTATSWIPFLSQPHLARFSAIVDML